MIVLTNPCCCQGGTPCCDACGVPPVSLIFTDPTDDTCPTTFTYSHSVFMFDDCYSVWLHVYTSAAPVSCGEFSGEDTMTLASWCACAGCDLLCGWADPVQAIWGDGLLIGEAFGGPCLTNGDGTPVTAVGALGMIISGGAIQPPPDHAVIDFSPAVDFSHTGENYQASCPDIEPATGFCIETFSPDAPPALQTRHWTHSVGNPQAVPVVGEWYMLPSGACVQVVSVVSVGTDPCSYPSEPLGVQEWWSGGTWTGPFVDSTCT